MIRGASRDVVVARAATPRPRAQALADERRGIDPHRRAHVVEGVLRAADDVVHVRGARRDIVAARGGARAHRARARAHVSAEDPRLCALRNLFRTQNKTPRVSKRLQPRPRGLGAILPARSAVEILSSIFETSS